MKTLFFFAFLSIVFSSCGDSGSESGEIKNMPVEQQLAVIDANGFVEKTDIMVIRIKTLLTYLSKNYNEPIDSIANQTSRAQGVIHDHGIEETNLNILEEMNKLGKVENTRYRDAVVLYAMMRSR